MNEYEIAFVCGVIILGAWWAAYIICWIAQYVWAWIDDSKVSYENWIASKINFSKYKYPLYNKYSAEGIELAIEKKEKPFGYSKNKKDKNSKWSHVNHSDKVYEFNRFGGIITVSFCTSIVPFLGLLSFKFYPVTLSLLLLLALIYIARVVVRGRKLFNKHIKDKDAHKA